MTIRKAPLAVLAAWVSTGAVAASLPLRPGDYVSADQPCRDAPLAAMVHYDGHGFGGPHASRCASTILARRGDAYRISTTCGALGDGTAAPPSSTVNVYRIVSPFRFVTGNVAYRRCPAIN